MHIRLFSQGIIKFSVITCALLSMVTECACSRRDLEIYKMFLFLEGLVIRSSLNPPIWLDSLGPINTILVHKMPYSILSLNMYSRDSWTVSHFISANWKFHIHPSTVLSPHEFKISQKLIDQPT